MSTRFTRGEIRNILGDAHTEDIENKLIALHLGVIDPLKDDLARYKADAEKLSAVQKELDDIKSGKDWRAEHDALKASFDAYKADVAGRETLAAKQTAYRALLTAENIPAKYHDRILRMTDFDAVEMDGAAVRDEAKHRASIKADWGDFIATPETRGAQVDTPPASGKTTVTRADIYKKDDKGRYVMSTAERQKALAENPDLMKS